MNRVSAVLIGLCLSLAVCFAQDHTVCYTEAEVKALLKEDPYRAANAQFVFFRNRKGSILVKVLVNEQEKTFPALEAVNGVYYEWPVLKGYLERLFI